MNIHIDIFAYDENYKLNEQEHVYYTEILKFVSQRLSPLKDEIEREEELNNHDGVTSINVIDYNKRGFISHHNYSLMLTQKMTDSFSMQDIKYITDRIHRILNDRGIV